MQQNTDMTPKYNAQIDKIAQTGINILLKKWIFMGATLDLNNNIRVID